jgi:N-acetylneuraminate synthase
MTATSASLPEFPYRAPRESEFDFQDIYVLDLANNHQGSVEHGLRVVRECAAAARKHGVRAMFKFQFRQLDTFVHPSHQKNSGNKHIPRFLGTRLERKDFQKLLEEVRTRGLLAACTPFDEESVDIIAEMGFDVLKIASCSATDWPLLEKAAESGLPVLFSTGGLEWADIDNICSFFDHRRVCYAIMHCVSIYPTPDADFQLNQIDLLKRRYPGVAIGFSTHERPEEILIGQLAAAKGAQLFERHVGVATDKITLNAYSSTPAQLEAWFGAINRAKVICGSGEREPAVAVELESLQSLKRGVYARRDIAAEETLTRGDVYFAMPFIEGQLSSGKFDQGGKTLVALAKDAPLVLAQMELPKPPLGQIFYRSIHEAKGLLNEARIALGSGFSVEFSHHYGLERFREVGAIIIDCVNRSYCKKLVIQFPGQRHPAHYHKAKEETFQVLYGILDMEVDGQPCRLYPGQTVLIQQGVWHRFTTPTGVIFEEISTTHIKGDSYYEDKTINNTALEDRKTKVENWGRYQLGKSASRAS